MIARLSPETVFFLPFGEATQARWDQSTKSMSKLNLSCPIGLMAQPAAPEQKPDDDENWWQKEW